MKAKQIIVAMATLFGALATLPGLAHGGELEDMKATLQQLQARIDQLETRQAAAPAAPAPVAAGNPSLLKNANVTVYGKLDLFAEYDTRGSQGTRLALESGGMNGSRWGIKGGADIAPDLRGIFQVEGGFYANQGRSSQGGLLFGRQAYAGFESRYGSLTAGRQYSPLYNTVLSFDPFEQGYGSPTNSGQVTAGTTRYDSSLIYQSPLMNGFSATVMAALGGQTGSDKHDATALALNYGSGPVWLAAAYQRDDHLSSATAASRQIFVGGSYQFASTRLMGGISRVHGDQDTGGNSERREWMIGTRTAMTPTGKLLLIYGRGKTDGVADNSGALAAGWIEALGPQTNVYGVVANHTNGAASALVPRGTSSAGEYAISNGDSALGLALGFQYSF